MRHLWLNMNVWASVTVCLPMSFFYFSSISFGFSCFHQFTSEFQLADKLYCGNQLKIICLFLIRRNFLFPLSIHIIFYFIFHMHAFIGHFRCLFPYFFLFFFFMFFFHLYFIYIHSNNDDDDDLVSAATKCNAVHPVQLKKCVQVTVFVGYFYAFFYIKKKKKKNNNDDSHLFFLFFSQLVSYHSLIIFEQKR